MNDMDGIFKQSSLPTTQPSNEIPFDSLPNNDRYSEGSLHGNDKKRTKYGTYEQITEKIKEIEYNNIKTPKPDNDDATAKIIGDMGWWQARIAIMMTLLKLPIAWYQLNIIFMAPPQEFWCAKPDTCTRLSEEEWRKTCAPHVEEQPCLVFEPTMLSAQLDKSIIPLVPCKHFVYDNTTFTRTMQSEWDLVCSKHWHIHLCQCVMMSGILVGGIIFGLWSDKYGRKEPLIVSLVIQGGASYLASLIPTYRMFLVNWFILALGSGGVSVVSFVICFEVVSGKWRTIIPVIYQLPFGLGTASMAGLAYWLRDWRKLEFTLATISSLFIFYWFWLPESPRWLIAKGKTKEASEILLAAAKENRREVDPELVKRLLSLPKPQHQHAPGFLAFLKSKNMRKKIVLLSLNWFCTGLSFYAFSQYLGWIGGNIFVAVSVTGIISILGGLSCIYIVTKYGRKTTVCIYQVITTLCFIFILMIPKYVFSNDWPRLLFAGIGFSGMAGTIPTLYLFSGELFPTLGRNMCVSGVTMLARIASMVAPTVVMLNGLLDDLPLMILAVVSLLQILMVSALPETKGAPLPDTLEEAEKS